MSERVLHDRLEPVYRGAGFDHMDMEERSGGFASPRSIRRSEAHLLRAALAREAEIMVQKDTLLQHQQVLRREADHRLMNGLQMVGSLLSLQSRAAATPAIAQHFTSAAHRVGAIERVHRRLHELDGRQAVAFKSYLVDLCRDVASVVTSDDQPERTVNVESIELNLPTATAIPLGFIANELITNAAKHGVGRIQVCLAGDAAGYQFSVTNDGPALPAMFDPADSKGLGMKLIQSFIRQIGGRLAFGPGTDGHGACFLVDFSLAPLVPAA